MQQTGSQLFRVPYSWDLAIHTHLLSLDLKLSIHIYPFPTHQSPLQTHWPDCFTNACGVTTSPTSSSTYIDLQRLTRRTLTSPENAELSAALHSIWVLGNIIWLDFESNTTCQWQSLCTWHGPWSVYMSTLQGLEIDSPQQWWWNLCMHCVWLSFISIGTF